MDTNIPKAYTPKYILYAHGIEGTDKAAYAYVEKDDEGSEILTFALIRLSEGGMRSSTRSHTSSRSTQSLISYMRRLTGSL